VYFFNIELYVQLAADHVVEQFNFLVNAQLLIYPILVRSYRARREKQIIAHLVVGKSFAKFIGYAQFLWR
jgi:hypothetical protein